MHESAELLQKLDVAKLMDVVKNYKQYGYDENMRAAAIRILKERGVSEDDLRSTGHFSNTTYDTAANLQRSYKVNSAITLCCYILSFVLIVVIPHTDYNIILLFAKILCSLGYVTFLIKSFLDHSNFYKVIGKKLSSGDELIYFILGMPFYILMYFFYRSQLNEEMQMIS